MNIKLIDIDSRIPNLALMQISGYYKARGDTVGFDVENPDLIYVSCVFTKNRGQALGVKTMFHDIPVIVGGIRIFRFRLKIINRIVTT